MAGFVRRGMLALAAAALLALPPALASESHVLTAPEALRRLDAGALVLIDVRSPAEWRQTGVPRGALAISIHDPRGRDGFLAKVRGAVPAGRAVATICAAGVRSERARTWLLEAGMAVALTVREGMLGRWRPFEPDQPGWLKRGLPVVPWPDQSVRANLETYPAASK